MQGYGQCLARLRSRMGSEGESTTRIGRFVLKSAAEASRMSIAELARASGASTATVTRFCRGLGYQGFKEFQLDLAAALAQQHRPTLDDFEPGATPDAIVQHVFEYARQNLADTAKLVDRDTLVQVSKLVRRADRVLLLGGGGSGLVAAEAAQRFLSLGLPALAVTDPYGQIFATTNTRERDVVFGISHTGQNAVVVNAVSEARTRGARTVALTNYPRSPLAAACEFLLTTVCREHRVNAAVSSSTVAQMCILDSIYFLLGSWGGDHARQLAAEAEERVHRQLRMGTNRKTSPDRDDKREDQNV